MSPPHRQPLLSLLYPRQKRTVKKRKGLYHNHYHKRQQGDKSYCDWTPESRFLDFQSDELMASASQIPTYPPCPARNRTDGEAAVQWEASCSLSHQQGLEQGSARNVPVIYHSCAHHKASEIPTALPSTAWHPLPTPRRHFKTPGHDFDSTTTFISIQNSFSPQWHSSTRREAWKFLLINRDVP